MIQTDLCTPTPITPIGPIMINMLCGHYCGLLGNVVTIDLP